MKAYPGTDVDSDHNPLIAKLQVRLKRIKKARVWQRMEIRKLQRPEVKEKIQRKIHENLDKMNIGHQSINEQWKAIKNTILDLCRENLIETKRKKKE